MSQLISVGHLALVIETAVGAISAYLAMYG